MRFWTSPYRRHHNLRYRRPRLLTCVLVGSLVTLVLSGGGARSDAATWQWFPWFSLAPGYESDLVLDTDLDRTFVPGGYFLDFIPAATLRGQLNRHTQVRFYGQASVERFFNTENRTLFGSVLASDLLLRGNTPWRGRLTLGGTYFTDSQRSTVQRFTGGLEGAIGLAHPRWRLDLLVALQKRKYPQLIATDAAGLAGTYTEDSMSLGAGGALQPTGSLLLTGEVRRQGTDARDPLFDSVSWTVSGSAHYRFAGRALLTITGLGQDRSFTSRAPGQDGDSYWQMGTGLEYDLSVKTSLTARYAFARYTEPAGFSQSTHRVTLAVTWRLGRSATITPPPELAAVAAAEPPAPRQNEPYLFRLHAPGAEQVAVVSDFNRWDPDVHRLQPVGDGWWQLEVRLPAGSHQYAYWIDGILITPPEADITVDDGFGGRNGVLRVME